MLCFSVLRLLSLSGFPFRDMDQTRGSACHLLSRLIIASKSEIIQQFVRPQVGATFKDDDVENFFHSSLDFSRANISIATRVFANVGRLKLNLNYWVYCFALLHKSRQTSLWNYLLRKNRQENSQKLIPPSAICPGLC